jgi:hypothetical protein
MTSTRPPAERAPPVLSRKRSSSAPTTRTPACSTSCAFSATPISTFSSPPVAPPTTTTSTTSSFCAKVHRTRPRAAAVFDAAVGVLLNTTADYAATSPMRFGSGVHLDTPTIFSLVQCVPSLTLAKCGRCLAYVVGNIGASCSGARSCMVCRLSCGFVHQQSRFYSGSLLVHPPPAVAPSTAVPTASSSGHQKGDQSVACINLSLHQTPLIQLVNMHVDQSIASVHLCIILYAALIN